LDFPDPGKQCRFFVSFVLPEFVMMIRCTKKMLFPIREDLHLTPFESALSMESISGLKIKDLLRASFPEFIECDD
ncbi:MAG: hypothetical protein KAR20_12920, partial [Candidatus Heimdallarchaeota archaeon]|nr:hypothetical protein [Candidatus Heimdallarchaeota archaeon]